MTQSYLSFLIAFYHFVPRSGVCNWIVYTSSVHEQLGLSAFLNPIRH